MLDLSLPRCAVAFLAYLSDYLSRDLSSCSRVFPAHSRYEGPLTYAVPGALATSGSGVGGIAAGVGFVTGARRGRPQRGAKVVGPFRRHAHHIDVLSVAGERAGGNMRAPCAAVSIVEMGDSSGTGFLASLLRVHKDEQDGASPSASPHGGGTRLEAASHCPWCQRGACVGDVPPSLGRAGIAGRRDGPGVSCCPWMEARAATCGRARAWWVPGTESAKNSVFC
jgi:hypothetical protein